jgi:hypothetical protein
MRLRTDPPPPPTHRPHLGLSHLTKLDPSPADRVNTKQTLALFFHEIRRKNAKYVSL